MKLRYVVIVAVLAIAAAWVVFENKDLLSVTVYLAFHHGIKYTLPGQMWDAIAGFVKSVFIVGS